MLNIIKYTYNKSLRIKLLLIYGKKKYKEFDGLHINFYKLSKNDFIESTLSNFWINLYNTFLDNTLVLKGIDVYYKYNRNVKLRKFYKMCEEIGIRRIKRSGITYLILNNYIINNQTRFVKENILLFKICIKKKSILSFNKLYKIYKGKYDGSYKKEQFIQFLLSHSFINISNNIINININSLIYHLDNIFNVTI